MSRKRHSPEPGPTAEGPQVKRHLNSALAAELQSLRIGGRTEPQHPPQHFFGASVVSSPFLYASPRTRVAHDSQLASPNVYQHDNGVTFSADFADTLDERPKLFSRETTPKSDVVTPSSSSSSSVSMMLDDDNEGYMRDSESVDVKGYEASHMRLETSNDNVIVEDIDAPISEENRLVVYRPPVKTSAAGFSELSGLLPNGQYFVRNPGADEWVLKEVQNNRNKRKLALVPWRGGTKRFCDSVQKQAVVIPMPWHESTPEVDAEQVMEVEDIS